MQEKNKSERETVHGNSLCYVVPPVIFPLAVTIPLLGC